MYCVYTFDCLKENRFIVSNDIYVKINLVDKRDLLIVYQMLILDKKNNVYDDRFDRWTITSR